MNLIHDVSDVMRSWGTTWVLILMLVLSVLSVAIMLERGYLYISTRDDTERLTRELGKLLRAGDLDAARKRLEKSPSAEAAVVYAGLVEADQGPAAAEEAMAAASAQQKLKLEKRLAILGTIGNNAPFIGLLGTVIGIVGAFHGLGGAVRGGEMAAAGPEQATTAMSATPAAVMDNISEALVATAIGLFIAIPAVAAYNGFQRVVRGILSNTDALAHVLLAHLKAVPQTAAAGAGANATAPLPPAVVDAARLADKKKEKDHEEGAF